MRRALITLAGLLLAGTLPAGAQAPTAGRPPAPQPPAAGPGEVRGVIVDAASGAPIPRASVAVRTKANVIAAGAIAGPDGAFRIQGLRPGSYALRATFLGFGPVVQEVTITPAAPLVDAGTIKLARVAVQLTGVTVQEERDAVSVEPDRNSYRAKAVAPAATNASEVLDAVPSVQVDGDGKVSLRGNENVAVQINGRPTPITGAQLASYLKSLPANIVERVEVVPNPSARYDPEGMAGIINIVLKQNTDLGLSTALMVGAAQTDRYNASGNVGYQRGRFSSMSNVGVNKDVRNIAGVNERERLGALRAAVAFTDQDIDGEQDNAGQNFTTSIDWKLNARDLLSNAFTVNHRDGIDASSSAYFERDGARTLTDRYDRLRTTDSRALMLDYTAAFKRSFTPRTHELSAELRVSGSHDEEVSTLWRQTVGGTVARNDGEIDETDSRVRNFSGQLDYVRPLGKKAKLETGYKGTARRLDRDFLVRKDALGTGDWIPSDLSNALDFEEQVHAVYGVASATRGKLDLQAGLRAEYADRQVSLAGDEYPFAYRSLYPSGVVTYNWSQFLQTKASYSRRVRRPGSQELNPFPSFFDTHNVFLGNPNLSPEYTDALELGLMRTFRKGNLQLSPFYRRTQNVIRVDINTADTVDGREVTSVSFRNLATSNSWGTDLNGSLRLGPRLNAFGALNVFRMVTDGGSSSVVGSDAIAWSTRFNASTELTKSFMVQAMWFYRAPMKIERGEFSSVQSVNLVLRQKLRGDKAIATLRFSDPFNTQRFRITTGDDNIIQFTERQFGVRAIFLNLQLTYGQTPRVRQPRQDEQQAGSTGFPGG